MAAASLVLSTVLLTTNDVIDFSEVALMFYSLEWPTPKIKLMQVQLQWPQHSSTIKLRHFG